MATNTIATPLSETGLPANWEVRHSQSHDLPYYFNVESGQSSWEPPEGADVQKLKEYLTVNMTAASDKSGEEKVRASHLLIKHRESRRPSSWKEAEITRTKDEAKSIILGHEARIRSGAASLGELAKAESDCSSARRNGDLGFFGRGEMQKEFEDATFALKPGEMSRVIETSSGYHLIERTA